MPPMLRFAFCMISLLPPCATQAAPDICAAAAAEIEVSLRAYKPLDRQARISIANAAQQRPAAGLDFGSGLDGANLEAFPLTAGERASFKNAVGVIYRAGGPAGLVMLDAVRGTADCHSPFLFTTASGSPQPLKAPEPGDPFELCLRGGVALGAAGGSPFYAQASDDLLETDALTIFPLKEGNLSAACTISASYEIVHETAESFCREPALCSEYSARAAKWATEFGAAGGADQRSFPGSGGGRRGGAGRGRRTAVVRGQGQPARSPSLSPERRRELVRREG